MASQPTRGRRPNEPLDVEPDEAEAPSRIISTAGREQEESIRDRKSLMFDDEELPPAAAGAAGSGATVVARPFREYLRTTPPAPLSAGMKAALYTAGAVVLLLLAAAFLKQS